MYLCVVIKNGGIPVSALVRTRGACSSRFESARLSVGSDGRSLGFVRFGSREDANAALRFDCAELDGRRLRVSVSILLAFCVELLLLVRA